MGMDMDGYGQGDGIVKGGKGTIYETVSEGCGGQ